MQENRCSEGQEAADGLSTGRFVGEVHPEHKTKLRMQWMQCGGKGVKYHEVASKR